MSDITAAKFNAALQNAQGIDVKSGAEIEHEYSQQRTAANVLRCDRGHKLHYKHSVGAFKCWHGALVRGNGQILTPCQQR